MPQSQSLLAYVAAYRIFIRSFLGLWFLQKVCTHLIARFLFGKSPCYIESSMQAMVFYIQWRWMSKPNEYWCFAVQRQIGRISSPSPPFWRLLWSASKRDNNRGFMGRKLQWLWRCKCTHWLQRYITNCDRRGSTTSAMILKKI